MYCVNAPLLPVSLVQTSGLGCALEPVELVKIVSHVCDLLRPEAAARELMATILASTVIATRSPPLGD